MVTRATVPRSGSRTRQSGEGSEEALEAGAVVSLDAHSVGLSHHASVADDEVLHRPPSSSRFHAVEARLPDSSMFANTR
jgi:hypothetical protein